MNADSQAACIANDLENLMHRIEALPGHTRYTDALLAVQQAMVAIKDGRLDLHQVALKARFDAGTARRVG